MKIRGIPIRFHWAWFVAIVLITLSLGTTLFPARSPEMSPVATWASSFATALLIYLSVLLHELAHAIEAQQAGMYVRKITMHFFGGLADIGSEFWLWKTELKVAAAGPLLSLILFVILYSFHNVSVMCLYLATINLILIGFNIVPVFPLDGGRILRSLLWRYYGDMLKATEVSVIIAARLTYFIIFMGILLLFRQNYSWGVWLLILSFYLLTVNRGIFRQIEGVRDVDEHYSIRDLMVPMKDVVTLDYEREERMTVSEFCRKIHVPHGFVVYPVCGADLEDVYEYILVNNEGQVARQEPNLMRPPSDDDRLLNVCSNIQPHEKVEINSTLREAFVLMFLKRADHIFVRLGREGKERVCGILWREAIMRACAEVKRGGTGKAIKVSRLKELKS